MYFLFRSMNVFFCFGRWMYFLFRSMNAFFVSVDECIFCFGRWMYFFWFGRWMYFFVSVDECIFFCFGRWMYFFLFRSMNVFLCFGRWMYFFVSVDECICFCFGRWMYFWFEWFFCFGRWMYFFWTLPNPILPTQTFLDPPEPDFTYTNFFEPHRTRVYLHKLFWNPPNLILPTQTFWDHPEPDLTYTNSFGTPNRISPTLFFHIIRELFIALLFFSQTPLVALGCTTSKII